MARTLLEIRETAIGMSDLGQLVYLANGKEISRDDFNTLCLARIAAALEESGAEDEDDPKDDEETVGGVTDDIFGEVDK
jgi:ribosome assembly protein YihI (activator of Der GTPase)